MHRTIKHHWIFSDAEKLRAWIIILLTVNFEPKKVNISNTLLECGRGESLLSLDSWVDKFNEKNKGRKWNKSSVRRFLKLLENDSMIVLKSERKTTRLTVCNYERYQDERNANETQMKRKRNANETQMTPTKEREERKELKKEKNIYRSFEHLKISIDENKKLLDVGYSQKQIDEIYDSIENYSKNKNYKSLYLTSLKWLKKEYPTIKPKEEIPKETLYNYHAEGYGMQYNRTKKQMEHDRAICQGRISQITEVKQ